MSGTIALWRFDETTDDLAPRDELGNVDDLVIDTGLAAPLVVDAALGRGRRFISTVANGYKAQDKIAGTTLAQHDCSIQVALWWDFDAALAASGVGTVYMRGHGNSTVERVSAGLMLTTVDGPSRIGSVAWQWQTSAGADRMNTGGWFTPSANGEIMLLTATRRWISPTKVVLRYYLGDQLLAEYNSSNGGIPGGTTGTTHVGCRFSGGVYQDFFDGTIDELRVVDYELAAEEIAATWRRIKYDQQDTYDLVKQLHDPGFPISDDPGSRVQRETRQWGHGLGFMLAQARNARDNLMPDRAYGPALVRWEGITKARPPLLGDSNEQRRARVVSRIRQRGASIPGIGDALSDVLATAPANLDVFGFTQDFVEPFANGETLSQWTLDPVVGWPGTFNPGLQTFSVAAAAPFDGVTRNWWTARTSLGDWRGVHLFAKIRLLTLGANTETGFFFGNFVTGDFFLVSLAYVSAGNVAIKTEAYRRWVSQGQVTQVASIPWTTGWLHVFLQDDTTLPAGFHGPTFTKFTVAWSTVAGVGPFTAITDISMPGLWGAGGISWAGFFMRTTSGTTTSNIVFGETIVRTPYSERALRFYVYRDPTMPGDPDYEAAQHVLDAVAQAHTVGLVTRARGLICDDPNGVCDQTPCA